VVMAGVAAVPAVAGCGAAVDVAPVAGAVCAEIPVAASASPSAAIAAAIGCRFMMLLPLRVLPKDFASLLCRVGALVLELPA
jgi:hypothetical protein